MAKKLCYLIGFMGAGKTHWGRIIARRMQYKFVDLDQYIETAEGKSVNELFATAGEAGFRELERTYLQESFQWDHCVVSTGGGTPCFFDNIQEMNRHGATVYLQTAPALLARRLMKGKHRRPLLAGVDDAQMETFIREKVQAREAYYLQAQKTVWQNSDSARVEEEIIAFLQQ